MESPSPPTKFVMAARRKEEGEETLVNIFVVGTNSATAFKLFLFSSERAALGDSSSAS